MGETNVSYAVEIGGNYTPTPPLTGSQTVTITPAALIVTAKPKSIVCGNMPANTGVTYSGFVNGETESVLNGTMDYIHNDTQYDDKE